MGIIKATAVALTFAWLAIGPAAAATTGSEVTTVKSRIEHYRVTYRINDDLTHAEDRDVQQRVLDPTVLERLKEAKISYSSSVQKVDVIEAYTLKADGRRIDVPKDNFQTRVNAGHRGGGPVFSDRATLGLVFPDVAVGDAVRMRYRIVQTESIFPGHFDVDDVFFRSGAYDEVRVVVDAPSSLRAHYDVREMSEAVEERDGRRVMTLTWKNPQPVRENRRDWSVYNAEQYPGFSYSTFASYEAIARAYGERALPKAVPNAAVRKLAAELLRGTKDRQERIRVLYEWVARNITYAGNCVGVGAVVPHDTDFILGNRMGDCKDHATLLQALLATQGIKSTQALVNASSGYSLPKTPLVSSVNHVINYLPDDNLFLDSTSSDTPFGYLPDSVYGKPVLLVENFREGMKTPPDLASSSRQSLVAEVEYLPSGTARGSVKVEQTGQFAIESRAGAREMTEDDVREYMRELYDADGRKGFGKLDADDPADLRDTYRYEVQFEKPRELDLPGAGGLYIVSPYYSNAGIGRFTDSGDETADGHPIACSGGSSEETHVLRFPAGMTIFAIPDDVHLDNGTIRYDATYRREGATITVKRRIDDRTAGPVCDAAEQEAWHVLSRKVQRDLRAQIVYQLKEAAEAP